MQVGEEVYLHVNNGGITFRCLDDPEFGPVVEVEQSHFGAVTTKMRVLTDPSSLEALATLFAEAAEHNWPTPPALGYYLNGQVPSPWDDTTRATVPIPSGEEVDGSLVASLALRILHPSSGRVASRWVRQQVSRSVGLPASRP